MSQGIDLAIKNNFSESKIKRFTSLKYSKLRKFVYLAHLAKATTVICFFLVTREIFLTSFSLLYHF